MKKIFQHSQWNEKVVQIGWDLNNHCNQDCSYCPPVIKGGNFSNGSWETVENFADRLCDHYEKLGKLAFIGFGGSGEPTMVEWFPDLLRMINNRIAGCSVGTNLTAPIEWWEENGNYISRVDGSIHYEYTSLREKFDYIHHIRKFTRNMHLSVPMIPDKFDQQMEDINWWRENSEISIAPQVVFANMTASGKWKKEYTPEQKEVLKKEHDVNTYKITKETPQGPVVEVKSQIKVHLNESDSDCVFTGWQCYSGIDTLVIDSRGYVRKGWCPQHTMEQQHMSQWQWSTDPVPCNMAWCRQQHDLFSRKIKEDN
jgi:hypothetical protein